MDIFLIRHGECHKSAMKYYDLEKKTMNPPLTEKGIIQAEKLALRCQSIGFDVLFSSDLIRAWQTTEKILSLYLCEFFISTDLREIDMGDILIKSWDDYPDIYTKWLARKEDIPYPNGENGAAVWQRSKKILDIAIANQYQKVAIVCHGGTIRSLICGILDIPQQKRFYFGDPLENCSISIIKYDESQKTFSLATFNDYSHLL